LQKHYQLQIGLSDKNPFVFLIVNKQIFGYYYQQPNFRFHVTKRVVVIP